MYLDLKKYPKQWLNIPKKSMGNRGSIILAILEVQVVFWPTVSKTKLPVSRPGGPPDSRFLTTVS